MVEKSFQATSVPLFVTWKDVSMTVFTPPDKIEKSIRNRLKGKTLAQCPLPLRCFQVKHTMARCHSANWQATPIYIANGVRLSADIPRLKTLSFFAWKEVIAARHGQIINYRGVGKSKHLHNSRNSNAVLRVTYWSLYKSHFADRVSYMGISLNAHFLLQFKVWLDPTNNNFPKYWVILITPYGFARSL